MSPCPAFAIPINSIMHIVESIIEKGYIPKPYIGISIQDVSAETQAYGIPAGGAHPRRI
jgi:serine protease Do